MQLKSLPSVVRTWQPVIKFAYANLLPERPRRLTGCYTPSRIAAGVMLSMFLTHSVYADEIDYDKETCDHLLVKVEDYASSVLEIQETEKAVSDYKQAWKEPLSLLTQYSQLYVDADCDRVLLRKALYRLVQYRKINEPDILGTKRW